MFTKEDAISFLTKVLGFPNATKQLLMEDRLKLLSIILEAYQENIPFQSFSLMTEPLSNRHLPTAEEIVAQVGSGKGGICYPVNAFLKILFDALGYSTYHTMSQCFMGGSGNNHIITVVKDVVVQGDKYIVDAGTGFQTAPFPLDFEKESPVYEECYLKYKYVWEDSLLKRYYLRGEREGKGSWELFYESDMIPLELSAFDAPMSLVYTDPSITPFHTSLRAIRFPNRKAVCISDMKLLLEDDAHTLQETKLLSKEEFLDAVKKYFPQLVDDAEKAYANWKPT